MQLREGNAEEIHCQQANDVQSLGSQSVGEIPRRNLHERVHGGRDRRECAGLTEGHADVVSNEREEQRKAAEGQGLATLREHQQRAA